MRFFNGTVRYKDLLDDVYADLSNLLKSSGDVCAIVYCLERTACDDLSAHLSKNGISCAGKHMLFSSTIFFYLSNNISVVFLAYHAGLNDKLRSSVLENWISSKIQVVAATVAFGYDHIYIYIYNLMLKSLLFIFHFLFAYYQFCVSAWSSSGAYTVLKLVMFLQDGTEFILIYSIPYPIFKC